MWTPHRCSARQPSRYHSIAAAAWLARHQAERALRGRVEEEHIAPRKTKQCFGSTQEPVPNRTSEQIAVYNVTRKAARHTETRQALDAITMLRAI